MEARSISFSTKKVFHGGRPPPPATAEDAAKYIEAILTFVKPAQSEHVLRDHVLNEIAFFRECNARVVVTGFALSTLISARAVGVPLVRSDVGSFVPPVWEHFRTSELYDHWLLDIIPHAMFDRVEDWLIPRLLLGMKVGNRVARQFGVEPIHSLYDLLLSDLALVTDVPELLGVSESEMEAWRPKGPLYRQTTRLKYAGPIYADVFGEVPDDVHEFLHRREKPRVYVALASSSPEFITQVSTTLASLGLRAAVVATFHELGLPSSPDCLFKRYLPSLKVMPLCDLAIIHGGQASVQTAIASGVPLVGIPLQPEQAMNLKLVEQRGAGRCVTLRGSKKGKLASAIEDVLGNSSYRAAMREAQQLLKTRNGPMEVAKILKAMVK